MKILFNILVSTLSLLTAGGVFVHDAHATSVASLKLPRYSAVDQHPDSLLDVHFHADQTPAQSLLSNFTYQSPSVPPREADNKRQHPRRFILSRHAFDNSALPLIS